MQDHTIHLGYLLMLDHTILRGSDTSIIHVSMALVSLIQLVVILVTSTGIVEVTYKWAVVAFLAAVFDCMVWVPEEVDFIIEVASIKVFV